MPTIEERVAYLEGRMQDQTALIADLRNGLSEMGADMNRQFRELRAEMTELIGRVDDKGDRRFVWLVGIQMTGLIAVVSAVIGLYFK